MTERTGICEFQIPSDRGHDTLLFDWQDKDIAQEDRKDFEVVSRATAEKLFEQAYRKRAAVFTGKKGAHDLHKVDKRDFDKLEEVALVRTQLGGG